MSVHIPVQIAWKNGNRKAGRNRTNVQQERWSYFLGRTEVRMIVWTGYHRNTGNTIIALGTGSLNCRSKIDRS